MQSNRVYLAKNIATNDIYVLVDATASLYIVQPLCRDRYSILYEQR